MNAYWSQWDREELDAMHGMERDAALDILDEYMEDLGIVDWPCAECAGCNSCLGLVM